MNKIPRISDPMGKHWKQPPVERIVLDDTHAMVDQAGFTMLRDYSCSMPSGVYEGKMWKAKVGETWYLRWYGACDTPGHVSNNQRELLVA